MFCTENAEPKSPPQLASEIFDQVSNILILYSDILTPPQLASMDDIWDIVWPKFQIVISCRHNDSHRWEWANPSRHCLKLFQTYCLCGWFSVQLPAQNNCENFKQFQLKVTSVQRNTLSSVALWVQILPLLHFVRWGIFKQGEAGLRKAGTRLAEHDKESRGQISRFGNILELAFICVRDLVFQWVR